MVAAAVGAGTAVAGYAGSKAQANAAGDAGKFQTEMSVYTAINQQANLNNMLDLLRPYVDAGKSALGQQQDILGLNGNDAQQGVIDNLQNSPLFQDQIKRGEQSLLQNASATGGLRGGNTQAVLAQFSPAMLRQAILDRYGQLSGLSSLGENAAVQGGNSGIQASQSIANTLNQGAAASAGASMAAANANAQGLNSISSGLGMWAGLRGSNGVNNAQAALSQTSLGQSGFGTGLAYGNQDYGLYF